MGGELKQYVNITIDATRNVRFITHKECSIIMYELNSSEGYGDFTIMFDSIDEMKEFVDKHVKELERLTKETHHNKA